MKILNDIGLTKSEALVYERLLQLGENSVGILQKSLGMHPQIVYRTIESLNKKGDDVGIIIWATEPILLHIKNEEIATSYRHYFDELWSASKA